MEVIQSNSEALKESLNRTLPEDYLDIIQNDEKSYLHPKQPFESIMKGPISNQILQALKDLNYKLPSKIQSQVIPILNDQKLDLIAQSPSGTGKTASYIISMLLHIDNDKKFLQTICLFHTRELCIQSFKLFNEFNKYTNFKGEVCLKNESEIPPSDDVQLLFGTPTSIVYWIKSARLDVSNVKFLVIDEVDTILDKNGTFFSSTNYLLKEYLPKDTKYGFFASTIKVSIIDFIKKIRPNIFTIHIKRCEQCCVNIEHWYTKVENIEQGKIAIVYLIKSLPKGQTFVLVRSKKKVSEISDFLNQNEIQCKGYSSDLSPIEREQTINQFKNHEIKVLVATDVLSRGIDIPDTFLVINYQIPILMLNVKSKNSKKKISEPNCDVYIHRAGLAGRFGRNGICFTIADSEKDEKKLKSFCDKKCLNIPLNFIDIDELYKIVDGKDSEIKKESTSKIKYTKKDDNDDSDNDVDLTDDDDDYDDNFYDKDINDNE